MTTSFTRRTRNTFTKYAMAAGILLSPALALAHPAPTLHSGQAETHMHNSAVHEHSSRLHTTHETSLRH